MIDVLHFRDAEAVSDDFVLSLGAVFDVLATSRSAANRFSEAFPGVFDSDGAGGFNLSEDRLDLIIRETVAPPAGRTDNVQSLELNPSDRYLETVAAIVASDGQLDAVFSHGWPILSVGSGSPTVTEAGGLTNAPGGGLST